MVFSGNPGTGKTTVARIVGSIFQAMGILQKGHVVEVDRSDLVAEYVGQTAVKTMGKLKEAYEGVLFIDEAYSLTRSTDHDFGIEAVDTIVKEMEDKRNKLVVILAGYPQEMKGFLNSNPGLHSRFNHQIEFDDYSLDELMRINSLMLSKRQYRLTEDASWKLREMLQQEMVRKPHTHGNGRLVRNYLEEMILTKASLTVERKKRDGVTAELDLIDSEVAARVAQRLKGKT
ncbi:Stage V sporulation protein K [compost metagenome]